MSTRSPKRRVFVELAEEDTQKPLPSGWSYRETWEQDIYSTETSSIFGDPFFMKEVFKLAEKEALRALKRLAPLFQLKDSVQQQELLKELFGAREGDPRTYLEEAKATGTSSLLFTAVRGSIFDAVEGIF